MKAENGILKGELKVRGGKLIKCRMRVRGSVIEEIKFSGDFFMYPEEKIEELEEILKGVEFTEEKIRGMVIPFFDNTELIGASPEDFVTVVSITIKNLKKGEKDV